MKSRDVEVILRQRGLEGGTLYILTSLVEQVNQLEKNLNDVAQVQHQMTDTVANVVEGSLGMRDQMMQTLRKAGVQVSSEEVESDGLGPTHLIGRDQ
jgi:molecular chaperone GrpE (heat shock protein)